MLINMQTYLLALDVFALTALLMAASVLPGQTAIRRNRILLSLFGLVLARSFALIFFLRLPDYFVDFSGLFEIISLFCIVWALIKSSVFYRAGWLIYFRAFPVVTLLILIVTALTEFPWEIGVIIIALLGIPLVYSQRDEARQVNIAPILILAGVAFLSWRNLPTVAQFVALMAYAALVYAIFTEAVISVRARQQVVETLGAETRRVHTERLRFIEVSSALSAAHSPTEILDEAVKVVAKTTQSDQTAIIAFSPTALGSATASIAAIYSADNSVYYTSRDDTQFNLYDIPALSDIQDSQQALLLTSPQDNEALQQIYKLWDESRIGPMLLQPLILKQRLVGILLIAKPVSQKTLPTIDVRLAQSIAPQLASILVYQSQYQKLELESEALAARLQLSEGNLSNLRHIIEALGDGVIVSNLEGKIELANSAAEKILQKPANELLNQPINTIYGDITANTSIEKLAAEFSRSKRPLPTYFERHDLAVQGKLIPLRNNRQEWVGMLVLLRDVTKEVNANKTKQAFLETVSRELRSPLTMVSGYVDLMIAGATGPLDSQQSHFMTVIKGGINKVIDLVNYATHMVDHEAHDLKLDIQPVNIRDVIWSATQTSKGLVASRRLQLTTDVPPDLPTIQADPIRLRQVLDYALTNTCQHSSLGGKILLKAWAQADRLNGQAQFTDYLIISVAGNSDNGNDDFSEQVFDPTRKISPVKNLEEITAGSDLGRKVMQDYVEAHGGRVWTENSNVFYIALPFSQNSSGSLPSQ